MAPKKKVVEEEPIPVVDTQIEEPTVESFSLIENLIKISGDDPDSFRGEILREFHESNLSFAQECCLSEDKCHLFVLMMNNLIESLKLPSKQTKFIGDRLQVDEVFSIFEDLMLSSTNTQTIDRVVDILGGPTLCPRCVLSLNDVKLLSDYATRTFFSHFKLYQYCIVFPREVEREEIEVTIPSCPLLPDLNIAVELACRELPTSDDIPGAQA